MAFMFESSDNYFFKSAWDWCNLFSCVVFLVRVSFVLVFY